MRSTAVFILFAPQDGIVQTFHVDRGGASMNWIVQPCTGKKKKDKKKDKKK
jgi:hypothetical protein